MVAAAAIALNWWLGTIVVGTMLFLLTSARAIGSPFRPGAGDDLECRLEVG